MYVWKRKDQKNKINNYVFKLKKKKIQVQMKDKVKTSNKICEKKLTDGYEIYLYSVF